MVNLLRDKRGQMLMLNNSVTLLSEQSGENNQNNQNNQNTIRTQSGDTILIKENKKTK